MKAKRLSNRDRLSVWLTQTFPMVMFDEKELVKFKEPGIPDVDAMCDAIVAKIKEVYEMKVSTEDPEELVRLERYIILSAVDRLWQDHLYAMDNLRSSIGLRVYAQKDPLVEYKQEAFKMFEQLMEEIDQEIISGMFRSATSLEAFQTFFSKLPVPMQLTHEEFGQFGISQEEAGELPPEAQAQLQAAGAMPPPEDEPEISFTFHNETPKVGRNDPCPCGSGKKYKKCCGK